MYKHASKFRQALVRKGNRDTGGRNLVLSDSVRPPKSTKTALMRRLDKEAKRATKVSPRDDGPRLVKRPRSPAP